MKTNFTSLKKVVLITITALLPFNLLAQDEVGELFKGAPEDAQSLVFSYLKPLTTGFSLGLNSGWYTSAKAKKTLRFDIRITASAAIVPTTDKTFDVAKLNLQSMSPVDPNKTISPTVAGAEVNGVEMKINGNPSAPTFNLPQGTGIGYIPAPQAQFTIGLPKNIDVSFRYLPTIDMGEAGKISLFGIGGKVEVLPLILGNKDKVSPVDVAVAIGYTKLKWNLPVEAGNVPNSNQKLEVEFSGLSYDAIVSKQLSIFTPFVSVGYNTAESSFKALGDYQFEVPLSESDPLTPGYKTYTNPFAYKNKDVANAKLTAGFQLRLAILKLYASYTMTKYNYVNAGIGLGIGK